ncbi:MAG: MFS transporter [Burkholderiales bacterium]|nr:MAG: MFS transporter [Burkholderiales bacterium]
MALAWRMLAVLSLARMAMGLQYQSIAPVAPLLSADLGLDQAAIGWLIGMYLLPGVALALPGGLLGARLGDKRVVLIGLAAMTLGAALMASGDARLLTAGRLISGVGAAFYNVLAAKMVADWFSGKELVLAMSILINAWPVGITLALLVLGALGEASSWQAAFGLTAALAACALLLVAATYRQAPAATAAGAVRLRALGARTWRLLLVGSLPWMLFNAAFAVSVGFLPTLLVGRGMSVPAAGSLVSLGTFTVIVSVQLGGMIVHRFGNPGLLTVVGNLGWIGATLGILYSDQIVLSVLLMGLLSGLPAAVVVSLPGQFLAPSERNAGMGLFYTIYYIGNATLPGLAGLAADTSGDVAAAIWVAVLLIAATVATYLWFRLLDRRPRAAGAD